MPQNEEIHALASEAFGPEAVERVDGVDGVFFVRLEDRLVVLKATDDIAGLRLELEVKPGMWVSEKEEDDWDWIDGYDFREWLESASQSDGPGAFVCVSDELSLVQWLPLDGMEPATLRLTMEALLAELKRAYYEILREHS